MKGLRYTLDVLSAAHHGIRYIPETLFSQAYQELKEVQERLEVLNDVEIHTYKGVSNLAETLEFTGKHESWSMWFKDMDDYKKYILAHGEIFKIIYSDGSFQDIRPGTQLLKTYGRIIPLTR